MTCPHLTNAWVKITQADDVDTSKQNDLMKVTIEIFTRINFTSFSNRTTSIKVEVNLYSKRKHLPNNAIALHAINCALFDEHVNIARALCKGLNDAPGSLVM